MHGGYEAERVKRFANERVAGVHTRGETSERAVHVVSGRGEVVGAELVRNPDVAKISFTGSAAIGRSIMRDGAATMKRITLELGGKSPNILLEDADLKKAIPDAFMIGFMHNGQACVAGTRLLVPKSRFDEVKRALVDTIPAFPVGDPADSKTAVGPMVTEKQYNRVQSYFRAFFNALANVGLHTLILLLVDHRPDGGF